jgi:HNH endonuclease
MTYIPDALRHQITQEAKACCEYCLLSATDSFLAHEIDHIIAEKHRGKTEFKNLAYTCFDCNRHKGSDIGSIDESTGILTPLFNPRSQLWMDHFRLDGSIIIPLTSEGRVTEYLLGLNEPERILRRSELIELGRYPCK